MSSINLSLSRELLLEQFKREIQGANKEQAIELAILSYRLFLEQQQVISNVRGIK